MRILVAHNYYRNRGGEDIVFESECRLLESHGHIVERAIVHSNSIGDSLSIGGQIHLAATTIWSRSGRKRMSEAVRSFQPDVVHVHNTFPLYSPASLRAVHGLGVPVVQTLHNFRPLCSNFSLYRDGHVCYQCVDRRIPWPAVAHACYQGSRVRSATVAGMQALHRGLRTWIDCVDMHIATTDYARELFISGGFPPDQLATKPNFVETDLGMGDHAGDFVLYVGRLSAEKGIETLLNAWERMPAGVLLKIVGAGPLNDLVAQADDRNATIEWLGQVPEREVLELMGKATLVAFPSIGHETFGRTIIEAYSRGTPVVASDIGSARELIEDGQTGRIFPAGDARALATTLTEALCDRAAHRHMSKHARCRFEQEFSAERNYERLIEIYRAAIDHSERRRMDRL
jgi:glycosyltransferase involved in cell wall biosynthesis